MIMNEPAPRYRISSGLRCLPKMAPNKTEIKVTMIYAETEPNHTEKGLPDFADIPIPTNCVLSANSAKKTALKVIQNIFQSIFPPNRIQKERHSSGHLRPLLNLPL